MDDFSEQLSKALRYSMNTVENLLGQLASKQHGLTRHRPTDEGRMFRGVVADALQDEGREDEAELLRSDRPVTITRENPHNSLYIRPVGGEASQPYSDVLNQLHHHINTIYAPGFRMPTADSPTMSQIYVTVHGPVHHSGYTNVWDAGDKMADDIEDRLKNDYDDLGHENDATLHELLTKLRNTDGVKPGRLRPRPQV